MTMASSPPPQPSSSSASSTLTDLLVREFIDEKKRLEESEIETSLSGTPVSIYHRLLIVYISLDETLAAKFLWQRIPTSVKESNPDLSRLWSVGRSLFERDPPAAFRMLAVDGWTQCTTEEVQQLRDCTRQRFLDVVSTAYSSLSLSDFAQYVGLPEPEAVALAEKQAGWRVDVVEAMVHPERRPEKPVEVAPSEEKLALLTDFIAFLEK